MPRAGFNQKGQVVDICIKKILQWVCVVNVAQILNLAGSLATRCLGIVPGRSEMLAAVRYHLRLPVSATFRLLSKGVNLAQLSYFSLRSVGLHAIYIPCGLCCAASRKCSMHLMTVFFYFPLEFGG